MNTAFETPVEAIPSLGLVAWRSHLRSTHKHTDGSPGKAGRRRPTHAHSLEYTLKWEAIFLLTVILACILWSAHTGWGVLVKQFMVPLGLGLLLSVVVAKQHGLRRLCGHVLAGGIALLVTCWQITVTFFNDHPIELAQAIGRWAGLVLAGGRGEDPALFSFVVLLLATALSYGSVWCVIRTRWLWPMLAAHLVLLLCLLYPMWDEDLPVFMIFVLASLLLSLHVHLDVSIGEWTRSGIVYPVHLKRVMMRLGGITAVSILLLTWFLPAGYVDPTTANLWNQLQRRWNGPFLSQQATSLVTAYPFSDALPLVAFPQLSPVVVATVQSSLPRVYLEARWYELYTGAYWINGGTNVQTYRAQEAISSRTLMTSSLRQTITVVTPPPERYLLGAPGISSVSLAATVVTDRWNGEPVAWLAQGEALTAGVQYTVTSTVSVADAHALRTVPQPIEAAQSLPVSHEAHFTKMHDSTQLLPFLQIPPYLDPRIANLARQITAGMPTMYDKVVALESYLRTHYTYSLQVKLPPDQEAVSWFLFRSGHRGYCIYFATAMAILTRSLGIPARVVSGYAPGTYDPQLQRQIIRGTDAHSWTQVYFSGYGWVNFEPTAGFSAFSRTLPGLTSTGSKSGSLFGSGTAWGLYQVLGMIVGVLIVIALLLCMLCLLSLQRLRPRAQAGELYRCVCLLATWAGCVPRSWQTPHEYLQRLLLLLPQAAGPLERLCDLYVREQWAHPASAEHPDSTGGLQEVLNLWMQLRPQLVRAILSHWGRLILCKGVFKAVR